MRNRAEKSGREGMFTQLLQNAYLTHADPHQNLGSLKEAECTGKGVFLWVDVGTSQVMPS